MVVVVDVPEGSAGFTCSDDLVITRLDAGGRAEVAGVTVGMRVCQFMGEELPESRTWAELKKVAKGTPKPWQFGFGHSQSVPAAAAAAAAAAPPVAEPQQPAITPEERVKVRKLFRAARSGDEASLGQILDEGVEVNTATRDGWTALLQASWNGHDECVRMLRLAGATVQSASEQTAGTAPYLEARRMVFTERKAQAAGQGDRLKGAPGLSEIPMRSLYS